MTPLARQAGNTCVRYWSSNVNGVASRLPKDYAVGISEYVWEKNENDPVLKTFFPEQVPYSRKFW